MGRSRLNFRLGAGLEDCNTVVCPGHSSNENRQHTSMQGDREAKVLSGATAVTAAPTPAAFRIQLRKEHRTSVKPLMSAPEACAVIEKAWLRFLERERTLLAELKEVAQVLRNEAACVVQSYFRGYLLRRVLREELETTVIRWTDAPLGKKHEAEVSVCEPPHWRKKLSMHFCPLRKAYTCPVQIVKGRLRVQLLVDGRPFPPHRSLKKTVRQVHPATERDTQAWVESGSLGGPLRNPRLPAGGLLGTSEVKGIFGRTADCSPGSHRWSCDTDTQEEPPSSDTSSSHVWLWSNSSNGDEELSPLQRGPSWASGSHRSMGQQRRVPVNNLRGLRTRKSISTLDSDGHESPSSANESTGESAAALGAPAAAAVAPKAASPSESKSAWSPFRPALPSFPHPWALLPLPGDSSNVCTPREAPPGAPNGNRKEDPSRWKPSAEREPFDAPTFHTTCIQTALGRDREGAEWWGPREEDYPWSSWPWSLSVSPQTKASEAPPVVSGFQRDCRHFSGWSSLAPFTPARGARNCSNGGSGAMPPSHAWALQGSLGPPRKCREALMESADLTGALLWARKRSHSYWELRRPLSPNHLVLRFTRSLSLQW
ncbi:hypothetical protein cyc_06316 [Cyclospora cayetanensis]|uniref:Uncharacterized protein n=1 Tax=Cyclospora cayetanensis TaxID=88456 RepID=A0A1D3D3L7_9EIME|nr:hypothetical protein cyc_06316 [Cyclospora cayetanensis]